MPKTTKLGFTPNISLPQFITGPCTAHWPPPEGINIFTRPPDKKEKMKVSLMRIKRFDLLIY